jgi:hypothetical protein
MDAIKRYEFMRILKSHHLGLGLAVALIAGLLPGCTRYNPATGQSEVDYGATAGVAGAALGAAALGVALSNNNNGWNNGPVVVRGGGGRNVNVNRVNNVNVNRNQSVRGGERNRNVNRRNQVNRQGGSINRQPGNIKRPSGQHRPQGRPQTRPANINRGGANRARARR